MGKATFNEENHAGLPRRGGSRAGQRLPERKLAQVQRKAGRSGGQRQTDWSALSQERASPSTPAKS